MATQHTPRLSIPYPDPSNNDSPQGPAEIGAVALAIDGTMVIGGHGVLAARPTSTSGSPGVTERLYYATDTGLVYYDTGTSWVTIGSVTSFNGRTGAITLTAADIESFYAASGQIIIGTGAGTAALMTLNDANVPGSPTNLLTAAGDILIASGANTPARLAKGSNGKMLSMVSGLPAWITDPLAGKRVEAGKATGISISGTSFTDTAIAFGSTFTTAPAVTCTIDPSAGSDAPTYSNSGLTGFISVAVTNTGFSYRINQSPNHALTGIAFDWIAIGS